MLKSVRPHSKGRWMIAPQPMRSAGGNLEPFRTGFKCLQSQQICPVSRPNSGTRIVARYSSGVSFALSNIIASPFSPLFDFALFQFLLVLRPYLGRQLLDVPLVRELTGQPAARRLRTPPANGLPPDAELDHVRPAQIDMPGQALIGPRPALDARQIIRVPFQRLVRIEGTQVRLLARFFIRSPVHMPLDHVDIIDRPALRAVGLSLPVPEAIGIQVVDRVTRFSTHHFFTPNDIRHGDPSFFY